MNIQPGEIYLQLMFVGDVIGVSERGALGAPIVGINLPLAGFKRGTKVVQRIACNFESCVRLASYA